RDGLRRDRQRLHFAVDMRHKGQINEVEVLLDWNRDTSAFDETLAARFYERYEQLYGKGSSFRGARLELVTFRVRATAEMPRPVLRSSERGSGSIGDARRAARPIYWDESREVVQTPIYDGSLLRQNQWVHGPAVIETPDTSVVVRPGQTLTLDKYGNFELIFAESGAQHVALEDPK